MDCYAVMGNPIHQSKSPNIHQAFADQEKQSIEYKAQLVPTEGGAFDEAVKQFFAEGGRGLNVTVPFKEKAWELAEIRSPAAEKAGAVNTLSYNTQLKKYLGDNTDGCGLLKDLTKNLGAVLADKRVLILGAGGAVRGVMEPLLSEGPSCLIIANRTVEKAQQLVELFAASAGAVDMQALSFEALEQQAGFDVIINGTSASLQGDLPPLPEKIVTPTTFCYDMMYAATPTVFNQWAKDQGAAQTEDGLGMLVEQAAEAYYIWRGFRPDTQSVIQLIRAQLA